MSDTFKDSFWYLMAGGVLTFLGGVVGPVLTEWLRDNARRKRILSAFRGEISCILHLIEQRNYTPVWEKAIADIKASGKPVFVQAKVTRNYFGIFEHNRENIGLLHAPLPEKLVRFYGQLFAVLEDLDVLSDPPDELQNISTLLSLYENDLVILKNAVEDGKDLLKLIG